MPKLLDYRRPDSHRPLVDAQIAALVFGVIAFGLMLYQFRSPWNVVLVGVLATFSTAGLVCSAVAIARPPRFWLDLVLGLALSGIPLGATTLLIWLRKSDW